MWESNDIQKCNFMILKSYAWNFLKNLSWPCFFGMLAHHRTDLKSLSSTRSDVALLGCRRARLNTVSTNLENMENLEKSGKFKMVRENLEKSGNLTKKTGKVRKKTFCSESWVEELYHNEVKSTFILVWVFICHKNSARSTLASWS